MKTYWLIIILVLFFNNAQSQDSSLVVHGSGKIYYLGAEIGGPGIFGSVNYKAKNRISEKFWLSPVIGLTYAEPYQSPAIGIPIRLETNFKLSQKLLLTNQLAYTPWLNFVPRPFNDSLRKVYVQMKYDDGTFLTRRIEWFYSGSMGITYCFKKADLQISGVLIVWKPRGILSPRYTLVPFPQVSLYYKISE